MALSARWARWLFRDGPDQVLPVVLKQRRIFILPTGAGVLYAVVLFTMLLGAINYELSLGHALVFLLAGLGIAGMLHTFRNLLALRVTPGYTAPVFCGETAHFAVTVDNPSAWPRRALEVSCADNTAVRLDLAPHTQASLGIPCITSQRGRIAAGRLTFASRYPLGIFRAWSYPHPPLSCVVYPRPIETPLPNACASQRSAGSAGQGGQEDFSGLRERQPNDSPRHIAWKAAARTGGHGPLLVKQFHGGAADTLWLDWTVTPAGDTERRLSILAAWVLTAERSGEHYGLRLPGLTLPPNRGPAHRHACLEALALYA